MYRPGFHTAFKASNLCTSSSMLHALWLRGNAFLRYRRQLFKVPLSIQEAAAMTGENLSLLNILTAVTVAFRQLGGISNSTSTLSGDPRQSQTE